MQLKINKEEVKDWKQVLDVIMPQNIIVTLVNNALEEEKLAWFRNEWLDLFWKFEGEYNTWVQHFWTSFILAFWFNLKQCNCIVNTPGLLSEVKKGLWVFSEFDCVNHSARLFFSLVILLEDNLSFPRVIQSCLLCVMSWHLPPMKSAECLRVTEEFQLHEIWVNLCIW